MSGENKGAPREVPPPHAPEAGVWKRVLGPLYVTGVFWYRFHAFGVWLFPRPLIGLLVVPWSLLFWVLLRRIRRAVASNLEAVLGPCGFFAREWRILRLFTTYAWCLSERYEHLAVGRRAQVEIEGAEHFESLVARPQGFILLTAHLGSWEAGSFASPDKAGRRVHVVREGETDPRAQAFVRSLIEKNAGSSDYVTHFASDDPQIGLTLLDALRAGDIVALQGDRPRAWGKPRPGQLFSRPFPLPSGPGALARATNSALLPVFVFREGRLRYRCSFRPPIFVAATADRDADIDRAVDRFTRELEGAIREKPFQWFCFRKLW